MVNKINKIIIKNDTYYRYKFLSGYYGNDYYAGQNFYYR